MATAVSHHFMKNGNGKRENSQMDMDSDDPEFVPLSKRINNLHLHQSSGQSNHHHHHHHNHIHGHGHGSNHAHGHGHGHSHSHGSSSLHGHNEGVGALNTSSTLSPHSPGGQHHHDPGFGMAGHSPHHVVFNMNTCINPETRDSRDVDHASGSNGDGLPKSHNSADLHQASVYSQHQHQHQQNVNGLQEGIQYNPSLDASSNPHYYESNRELYQLYLYRMNRTRQVLHPQFYEPQ